MGISWRVMGIFAAVWLLAALVIFWARASRPTPASLAAYIDKNPLADLTPAKRTEVIDRAAAQLNKLDVEQRQELRKTRNDRRFFEQMTEDERKRFLDLTLPEGFRQLMLALNKMDPAKRKKIVERVLDDIEKDNPEAHERINRAEVQKMIAQGMDSFYSEASADVKLDFAPVIEQLQRATQKMR